VIVAIIIIIIIIIIIGTCIIIMLLFVFNCLRYSVPKGELLKQIVIQKSNSI